MSMKSSTGCCCCKTSHVEQSALKYGRRGCVMNGAKLLTNQANVCRDFLKALGLLDEKTDK